MPKEICSGKSMRLSDDSFVQSYLLVDDNSGVIACDLSLRHLISHLDEIDEDVLMGQFQQIIAIIKKDIVSVNKLHKFFMQPMKKIAAHLYCLNQFSTETDAAKKITQDTKQKISQAVEATNDLCIKTLSSKLEGSKKKGIRGSLCGCLPVSQQAAKRFSENYFDVRPLLEVLLYLMSKSSIVNNERIMLLLIKTIDGVEANFDRLGIFLQSPQKDNYLGEHYRLKGIGKRIELEFRLTKFNSQVNQEGKKGLIGLCEEAMSCLKKSGDHYAKLNERQFPAVNLQYAELDYERTKIVLMEQEISRRKDVHVVMLWFVASQQRLINHLCSRTAQDNMADVEDEARVKQHTELLNRIYELYREDSSTVLKKHMQCMLLWKGMPKSYAAILEERIQALDDAEKNIEPKDTAEEYFGESLSVCHQLLTEDVAEDCEGFFDRLTEGLAAAKKELGVVYENGGNENERQQKEINTVVAIFEEVKERISLFEHEGDLKRQATIEICFFQRLAYLTSAHIKIQSLPTNGPWDASSIEIINQYYQFADQMVDEVLQRIKGIDDEVMQSSYYVNALLEKSDIARYILIICKTEAEKKEQMRKAMSLFGQAVARVTNDDTMMTKIQESLKNLHEAAIDHNCSYIFSYELRKLLCREDLPDGLRKDFLVYLIQFKMKDTDPKTIDDDHCFYQALNIAIDQISTVIASLACCSHLDAMQKQVIMETIEDTQGVIGALDHYIESHESRGETTLQQLIDSRSILYRLIGNAYLTKMPSLIIKLRSGERGAEVDLDQCYLSAIAAYGQSAKGFKQTENSVEYSKMASKECELTIARPISIEEKLEALQYYKRALSDVVALLKKEEDEVEFDFQDTGTFDLLGRLYDIFHQDHEIELRTFFQEIKDIPDMPQKMVDLIAQKERAVFNLPDDEQLQKQQAEEYWRIANDPCVALLPVIGEFNSIHDINHLLRKVNTLLQSVPDVVAKIIRHPHLSSFQEPMAQIEKCLYGLNTLAEKIRQTDLLEDSQKSDIEQHIDDVCWDIILCCVEKLFSFKSKFNVYTPSRKAMPATVKRAVNNLASNYSNLVGVIEVINSFLSEYAPGVDKDGLIVNKVVEFIQLIDSSINQLSPYMDRRTKETLIFGIKEYQGSFKRIQVDVALAKLGMSQTHRDLKKHVQEELLTICHESVQLLNEAKGMLDKENIEGAESSERRDSSMLNHFIIGLERCRITMAINRIKGSNDFASIINLFKESLKQYLQYIEMSEPEENVQIIFETNFRWMLNVLQTIVQEYHINSRQEVREACESLQKQQGLPDFFQIYLTKTLLMLAAPVPKKKKKKKKKKTSEGEEPAKTSSEESGNELESEAIMPVQKEEEDDKEVSESGLPIEVIEPHVEEPTVSQPDELSVQAISTQGQILAMLNDESDVVSVQPKADPALLQEIRDFQGNKASVPVIQDMLETCNVDLDQTECCTEQDCLIYELVREILELDLDNQDLLVSVGQNEAFCQRMALDIYDMPWEKIATLVNKYDHIYGAFEKDVLDILWAESLKVMKPTISGFIGSCSIQDFIMRRWGQRRLIEYNRGVNRERHVSDFEQAKTLLQEALEGEVYNLTLWQLNNLLCDPQQVMLNKILMDLIKKVRNLSQVDNDRYREVVGFYGIQHNNIVSVNRMPGRGRSKQCYSATCGFRYSAR